MSTKMMFVRGEIWPVPFYQTDVPAKGYTQSGYGRDRPTRYMIFYKSRWRRVLWTNYGNCPSVYIKKNNGDWLTVDLVEK